MKRILFVLVLLGTIWIQHPKVADSKIENLKLEATKEQKQVPLTAVLKSSGTITVPPKSGSIDTNNLSRGGSPTRFIAIKTMTVQATAYTDDGITAIGRPTRQWHTVATDWRVIPRGTLFWTDAFGSGVIFEAEDVGGAIKGNIIDIYHPSLQWCKNWGRRNIEIHIIRWGEER